ncbi:MAG: alpha/beta hydrolase [Actinomycetota bacterium]
MVDVHPDLVSAVKRVPKIPITPRTIKLQRRVYDGLARLLARRAPLAGGVAVTEMTVPEHAGDGRLRVYRPLSAPTPTPVIAWIHGGGLVMGNPVDDPQLTRMADATGATVVSVGYRLAPEHPFPAAHDDLLAAIEHLVDSPDRFGIDAGRLVVGGQSAGGGLAASMAQRLHDRGVALRGQLLVYPMLDDRTAARDDLADTEHPVWSKASNRAAWAAYLPSPPGAVDQPEHAVPSRREDLTGLAPAWIGVGTADVFHDEDLAYAERLRDAGVEATLDVVDGAVHAFEVLAPDVEISREFVAAQHDFLRKVLV